MSFVPINCPAIADPMNSGINADGVLSKIRNETINGMDACIMIHHIKDILAYFARYLPKGMFTSNETVVTIIVPMFFSVSGTKVISGIDSCNPHL